MLLFFIALLSCKVNAYPMEDGSIPLADPDEENSKMSDDDEPMSWYKPIAVILKPATEKDLRERLTPSTRTAINYPRPQSTSFQQHLPWAYRSPWSPYFFRRNDDVQQQNNWFRNVYGDLAADEIQDRQQDHSISLSSLGLAAYRIQDMFSDQEADGDGVRFRGSHFNDVKKRQQYQEGVKIKGKHGSNKNNKQQWMHEFMGPPGQIGVIGPTGNII
jgi:hypothetical protein